MLQTPVYGGGGRVGISCIGEITTVRAHSPLFTFGNMTLSWSSRVGDRTTSGYLMTDVI